MNKFYILIQSIKIIKNWYMLLLVYSHIFKKNYYVLKLRNGLKIKLRNNSTDIHTFANIWIIQEYSKIFTKKNEVVIDIGGHIGIFSLYAWKHNAKKIFAFEPIKENFDLFKENISLNKIKNIECENIAVYDSTPEVKIYFNQDFAAHSLIKKEGSLRKVKSNSLKQIFDKNCIEKCDILKLDCEGSEYKILDELPNNYYNKIKKICLEYHIFQNEKNLLEKLKNKLKKMNFSLEMNSTNEKMGMLYAIEHENPEK